MYFFNVPFVVLWDVFRDYFWLTEKSKKINLKKILVRGIYILKGSSMIHKILACSPA